MHTIDFEIEGDYCEGQFTMFVVQLVSNGISIPIFLSAEQTNSAFVYNDSFEPILSLLNILTESGYSVNKRINIINGDNSAEQQQFVLDNNKIEYANKDVLNNIKLSFTDSNNPLNSNIIIESIADNNTFTIYTEGNEQSPLDLMKMLKQILNQ
jgi:hypothetical protein